MLANFLVVFLKHCLSLFSFCSADPDRAFDTDSHIALHRTEFIGRRHSTTVCLVVDRPFIDISISSRFRTQENQQIS